jgi:hypothetical protein
MDADRMCEARGGRSRHVDEHRAQIRQKQRGAIWKWRWLGLRDSTPGFKGSVVVLVVVAVYIAVRVFTAL